MKNLCRGIWLSTFFILLQNFVYSQAFLPDHKSPNPIHVPQDFNTIQEAIDFASNGAEIVVSQGTYEEHIHFYNKNIILRSTEPTSPPVVKATIIDGKNEMQRYAVVNFAGMESSRCVLAGFTITGGNSSGEGGGIHGRSGMGFGTRATIIYNRIIGNKSNNEGGGIYKCNGNIQNNVIAENESGDYGGGLCFCNGMIVNNLIFHNQADSEGGGLFGCLGSMLNNTIVYNDDEAMANCQGLISNCIVWGDSTTLYQCSQPFFSCVRGIDGGRGNIYLVPRFMKYDSSNPSLETCDFHLRADSPCIGAGNYAYLPSSTYLSDLDGNSRISANSLDMGCYEYDSSIDNDGDLLPDYEELTTDPLDPDSDGDGLLDGTERIRGTCPYIADASSHQLTVPDTIFTIQEAIFLAFPRETITVNHGEYHENLFLSGKNVILQSQNPQAEDCVTSTVINGDEYFSVVFCQGDLNNDTLISGFTITGGKAMRGGGICANGASVSIQNSRIIGNTVYNIYFPFYDSAFDTKIGGGIYSCHGLIQHNSIINNPQDGLYDCNGIIRNNVISANGNGMVRCRGLIQNNLISSNTDSGIYDCDGSLIQNNTIAGNGKKGVSGSKSLVQNCIIWDNGYDNDDLRALYSCIQNWSGVGRGNITDDPGFIDPAGGDWSLGPSSPCIDAGCTSYLLGDYIADVTGNCRVSGEEVDMGCHEYNSLPDADGDLLADNDEKKHGADAEISDLDQDGLMDGIEVLRGANPGVYDPPGPVLVADDYTSIQKALFFAYPKSEIIVEPGTYGENVHFLGKNLHLRGILPDDEDTISQTIIDGGNAASVITFRGNEDRSCLVEGLTLRNGYAGYYFLAGGISGNGAGPIIRNNVIEENNGGGFAFCNGLIHENMIRNNTAEVSGGGLRQCNAVITNNSLTNNTTICHTMGCSIHGGGLWRCQGIIRNNLISGNKTSSQSGCGGGMSTCAGLIVDNVISNNIVENSKDILQRGYGGGVDNCFGILRDNRIVGNTALRGGGVGRCSCLVQANIIENNHATVSGGGLSACSLSRNNIIVGNRADKTAGGYDLCVESINNVIYGNSAGQSCGGVKAGQLINCIVWGNQAPANPQVDPKNIDPSYSCIQNWMGSGQGNISVSPLFTNPESNDFHLMNGSPCIDEGNPDPQYNDQCLPPGKGTLRCDMGVYGGPYNCKDMIDLQQIYLDHILGRQPISWAQKIYLDLNGDANIDVSEIVILNSISD